MRLSRFGPLAAMTIAGLLHSPVAAQQVPVAPDAVVADTVVADTVAAPGATANGAAADTIPPAVAALDAAADSVLQLLRALPGFTVTEYRGDTAVYDATTGVLRLEGAAEVTRSADRLTADTIIYRDRDDLVEAYGNPRVAGGAQEIEGRVLYYDLARSRATALGARTQITQTATWYVQGDVTLEGTDRLFGRHAHFTSCDLVIPHYHFETDQIMVLRDRILVARPARLYFGSVPVMVLPFVVQSLEQGRRSGFLTPRFGLHDVVRTSSGYNRQISDVGFYWAVNEYMGAQLSTTWRSEAYTALLGNLEYNWRRQFLNGNVGVERYWRADGRREMGLNTGSSWQPDERSNLSFVGRYASSSDFIRESSYDPRQVTQDLTSTLSLNRRFDWGQVSLGGDRRQSIATGDVSTTLPSFSISPRSVTLFRAPTPEQASWFSNLTLTPGVIAGSRSTTDYADNLRLGQQDQETGRLRVAPSLSVGNLTFSASGDVGRTHRQHAAGLDRDGQPLVLPEFRRDEAAWSTSASYRQSLIGSTYLSPQLSLSQQVVRDTLTGNAYVQAPLRMSFGTALSTDLYGFFPGVGAFNSIRHRVSPRLSYSYAPEVQQSELQRRVFGRAGGRAQNRISVGFNQSWEAKLTEPVEPTQLLVPQDTAIGDTIPQMRMQSAPSDPQKVTVLSLTTSSFDYDFNRAREEGSGFLTDRVSNTINSDYLRGLSIQMQHELFDRRELNPADPANAGLLGRFSPQLSSLSTAFELGPNSSLIQWFDRVLLGRRAGTQEGQGVVLEGDTPSDAVAPAGQGSFTGNPQGLGGGPWRVGLSYQLSRPSRVYSSVGRLPDTPIQTLDASTAYQLTPNWSVNWITSYSLTDGQFGAHSLNFRRDLHEWQANFNFYQTPNGNTAFEFYVELLHNRDLRFDYAERDLGVDRRR